MTEQTVLVLAGYDLRVIPVVRWLADRYRVVLIATKNATNQRSHPAFAESVSLAAQWCWIDDAFDSYRTVEQAQSWHRDTAISHVVCLDELGLICAAELRALLGVRTGQQLDSATAFRVKSRMYDLVRSGPTTVPVAAYRTAETGFDVLRATDQLGLPVVIKPVDGGGSQDTHAIRSPRELFDWLADRPIRLPGPVLIQRFVAAPMYHVDGIAAGGAVHAPVVSRYGGSTLGYQQAQPLVSSMTDPASSAYRRLVEATEQVLGALPDAGGCAFHAEFFLDDDGQVHFCEIASRTGGAGVAECYRLATGVDPFWAHALLQCGGGAEVISRLRQTGSTRFGWYLQPAPTGTVLALPERCELPGVLDYDPAGRIGQSRTGPVSSVDAVAKFIVEFSDDAEAEKLFQTIAHWFDLHSIVLARRPMPACG
jgi:biotin carboxylase